MPAITDLKESVDALRLTLERFEKSQRWDIRVQYYVRDMATKLACAYFSKRPALSIFDDDPGKAADWFVRMAQGIFEKSGGETP